MSFADKLRAAAKGLLMTVAAVIILYAGHEFDAGRHSQAAYHMAQATMLLCMSMCV